MQLLFATPTAGGIVKARFAHTLFEAAMAVRDAGWRPQFASLDGSDVTAARNHFANLVLRQPGFTHLVMIDSDMACDGEVILRLLRAGRPVVGAAYAKRRLDLDALARAARGAERSLAEITALALRYNLSLESGTSVQVTNGMCRVERMALGCAAIRRDALEGLVAAGLAPARSDAVLQSLGLEGPFHDFFGQVTLPGGGRLSEDYSFCHRWRSVPGNEIWALVDAQVGHVGEMVFGAPYLDRLRQGEA